MTDLPLPERAALTADLPLLLRRRAPIVTVLGEPMLDGWWHGTSDRMAREAPAPVVAMTGRISSPGGAANTAMNLAALGAQVRIVGLVGDDEPGGELREQLAAGGVDVRWLLTSEEVRTITKTRVVVADQVLLRIDEGTSGRYPRAALERLAAVVPDALADADAELICDYGTGMLHGPVEVAMLARAGRPALRVVDAHEQRRWAALRPDLVTPNAEETTALTGALLRRDTDRVATVGHLADEVLSASGAAAAVVTLDRDGTVLLGPEGVLHRTWARPASDKQASGAGDTFAATLTVARVAGLPLPTSADLAQAAADVVSGRFGTSVCGTDDLVEHLSRFADSALSADELVRRLEGERRAGRRIVLTNGCFDVLHRGHTAYLNQAKRLGDVLVVAINSDDSVRRLKGETRPINSEADRAGVLAALSCVDYVTVFPTDTPIPLLERIRPDVYAKGGDYTEDRLPEATVVRGYGGDVRLLDYLPDYSTTAVVERIRTPAGPPPEPPVRPASAPRAEAQHRTRSKRSQKARPAGPR